MKTYRDLIVWQKSVVLVTEVYTLTQTFPDSERFGLSSQMRRAAVSIPSNIAEGAARNHTKEFIQLARIAFASGAELETQLLIAQNLKLVSEGEYSKISEQLSEIMKMLNVLVKSLKEKTKN